MPLENPKQLNNARYYIDERNFWCVPCARRMTAPKSPHSESLPLYKGKSRPCTECMAFDAGYHPALRRDTEELRAKLAELQALPGIADDYVAGVVDGTVKAIRWMLRDIETLDWREE